MAIIGGRIVAIGSDEEIARQYPAKADIDLQGQMVLPGFHDSHVHPVFGGTELAQCVLNEQTSGRRNHRDHQRVQQSNTRSRVGCLGPDGICRLFPQANPNKTLLDAISTERPIFLGGADGHSSWANSTALAAAGIERETPNPPNGIIERDANGEASGVLRESAQEIVRAVIPPISAAEREEGLQRALRSPISSESRRSSRRPRTRSSSTPIDARMRKVRLTARVVASVEVTEQRRRIVRVDAAAGPRHRREAARRLREDLRRWRARRRNRRTAATVSRSSGLQRRI